MPDEAASCEQALHASERSREKHARRGRTRTHPPRASGIELGDGGARRRRGKGGHEATTLAYRVGKPKISCRPQRIESLTRVLLCSSASSVPKQDNDGPRSHEVFYRREGQTRLPKVVGTR